MTRFLEIDITIAYYLLRIYYIFGAKSKTVENEAIYTYCISHHLSNVY